MENCDACLGLDRPSNKYKVEKILDSANVLGFLVLTGSLSPGHCLFLPRAHFEKMKDVDGMILQEIIVWVKRVANALNLENFNVLNNNGAMAFQTLFHVHFHLIPKTDEKNGLRYLRDWAEYEEVDQSGIGQQITEGIAGFL